MLKLLKKAALEERGTAVVIVAVAFTVLMGLAALAVDTGILYLEHTRLTRAMDAAALAGAQELPDTVKAMEAAEDYAVRNGVDPDSLTISFSANDKQITVNTTKTVDLYFARTFGFNSSTVKGRAVARIAPVRKIGYLIPLGINEALLPLSSGTEYMIKGGAQDGNPWRGIIKYPGQGNGGNEYRELMINGYDGTVSIGDILGQVPGNTSGPTIQGVNDRIDSCTNGCTWDNYEPGCPRIALVPIYRVTGEELEVVGFATVFLERVDGNGNDSRVWTKFINTTVAGETDESITDSYLNGVKLSE